MATSEDNTRRSKALRASAGVIEPGFWIAATLKEGAAPDRCVVGQVQAVDEHGIRITLVDWITGEAKGWDFFVPWEMLTTAEIATAQHEISRFSDEASEYQIRCRYIGKSPEEANRAVADYRDLVRKARFGK